jgi:uracil-DNA glycosylase
MTASTDKQAALEAVCAKIKTDDPCPHLRQGATQLVFADGSPEAEIVFIGEAPGAREDQLGKPFVGAAGKFLDEMLASIDLARADVYITNIVKYRPPGNRDPEPEEIAVFMPYLKAQLSIIKPPLVVFLGRHAMSVFMPELKISQVHGQPKRLDKQVYLPLFHPAAALYNGGMRQMLLEDFRKIPRILQLIKDK